MAIDSHDQFAVGPGLPGEVVKDILSADRRRTLLACLTDHGGEMPVSDLAACVGARERDLTEGHVDGADRDRLYDDLYDEHLPKLTATGVLEFDSMRDRVRLRSQTRSGK
jgi:hypothetical protein